MKITDVRLRAVKNENELKLKAYADVTFDECFVIHGLKIIDGQKGMFVAMPSRKMPDGEYKDIAHPITPELAGCLGCDGCKRTGVCVIKDDAVGLVEKIVEADMVIFGSPVYWWGISSQTKALIDRIYMKNSTLPQLKKKIGVVAVGADELSGEQYKLIKGQFDCICEYLGWEFEVYKPISAGLIGDVEKQVGLMRELKEIGQKL